MGSRTVVAKKRPIDIPKKLNGEVVLGLDRGVNYMKNDWQQRKKDRDKEKRGVVDTDENRTVLTVDTETGGLARGLNITLSGEYTAKNLSEEILGLIGFLDSRDDDSKVNVSIRLSI